ncbi:hypothetical protein MHTCC0001_22930 [Flavobacteriaceae bacterium MHTCC 0001]
MKNNHRIFVIQVIIALSVFLIISYVIKTIFYNDPKAKSYIYSNQGVKEMASSTSELLDSLIVKNEVTFDPTSGKELDKVFDNLKQTNKEKILFVGSSQLRVVQGKKITSTYKDLVSQKIEDYSKKIGQQYNLSLGGMTTQEKLIVAKKGVEFTNPDNILISVTPWDCISKNIRKSVNELKNKKVIKNQIVEIEKPKNKTRGLLKMNTEIEEYLSTKVERSIEVYSKRAAIKSWLHNKTIRGVKDGVLKEDLVEISLPEFWRTNVQELSNTTGWVEDEVKTGKKSVKIINIEGKNARWAGEEIALEKSTNTFEIEGWSKAENVSQNTRLYGLDIKMIFEDETSVWYYKTLRFSKGTHDWEKVNSTITFDKKVKKILPYLILYKGTGTVWFDDVRVLPIHNGYKSKNIIPNSSFEESLKQLQNVSYQYNDDQWTEIQSNIYSIVDFLAAQKSVKRKVLLFTPYWHNKSKTAYPQTTKYKKLRKSVKDYCAKYNVEFVDASHILSKDNFGIYTQGSVKDKIDVLHFDAEGHDKLARYIIKQLDL